MFSKKFVKLFETFEEGIKELAELSFSANDALTMYGPFPKDEKQAVQNLAWNVAFDRQTGNQDGWNQCKIIIEADGIHYQTSSGLKFGWCTVFESDGMFDGAYNFYIIHKDGTDTSAAPAESTLRKSAEKFGWKETSEYLYAR